MSWTQGRTLHTTRTGRAKPNGSVTRRSHQVKQPKYAKGSGQDRPLPLSLACHPQALTRTPLHPGCATNKAQYNVGYWRALETVDFLDGVFLCPHETDGYWAVANHTGRVLGYAPPTEAMQYKFAAGRKGVTLNVYQR